MHRNVYTSKSMFYLCLKKDKFYEKMSYFGLISWNNPRTSLGKTNIWYAI